MVPNNCAHIRVRDSNDYNTDVDNFIKSLEKEHSIDFRSLPEWELLVQRLHVAETDCKRKIQNALRRKSAIIDKLYVQSTRPSPFELTEGLCRTANKWRKMESNRNKLKPCKIDPEQYFDSMVTGTAESTLSKVSETLHQNTEILSFESPRSDPSPSRASKTNTEIQVESPPVPSNMPVYIFTNPHKLVSPLTSQQSGLSYQSIFSGTNMLSENNKEEWECLKPTSSVVCTPTPIILNNNTLKEQCVQFTVINCAGKYVYIRFKNVIGDSPFLRKKIIPVIPKRIYPGNPVVYKLIFRLKSQDEFKSSLYFKVGRDVYDDAPSEAFCIPVTCAFALGRSVIIPDSITIPPVYPWHIKRNNMYSTTTVRISGNDSYTYHIHIYKRVVDLTKESGSMLSCQATGPNTESVIERKEDSDINVGISSSLLVIEEPTITESIAVIAQAIIELALDSFIFEHTYLYLKPHETARIPVYFTKAEHIGYHQNYYDFEFIDPETETVVLTKTLKVFSEVLSHPIKIHPMILDMSQSPITHGFCQDSFVITNSHKLYPVTIKIKLTTKMKKMFYVEPMEVVMPESTSVQFTVRVCSRDFLSINPSEDLVHFTFKIVVSGYKAVYENVPPFYYEVIAPCAVEFKRVYNEKYFKE